jgi:ribosomal protein L24
MTRGRNVGDPRESAMYYDDENYVKYGYTIPHNQDLFRRWNKPGISQGTAEYGTMRIGRAAAKAELDSILRRERPVHEDNVRIFLTHMGSRKSKRSGARMKVGGKMLLPSEVDTVSLGMLKYARDQPNKKSVILQFIQQAHMNDQADLASDLARHSIDEGIITRKDYKSMIGVR